ncbi:MAG: diaminopimelate decarboxylase [Pseudomonadales bacterium]|jgi:diaminopimelate decarboxylase
MDYFNQRNGELYAEDVPVAQIAKQYGTPCYIYSRATLERHFNAYEDACGEHPHLICYAVKANSNLGVLNLLARLGAGFDIVSVGELERVLAAGGSAGKVVFSGVGKQAHEIRRALEVGVFCFNVESEAELVMINEIAGEMGCIAPVSLRVNPDVDAKTHPYISTGLKENKFGIDIKLAPEVYRQAAAMENIEIKGVDCHIGSQLTEIQPFLDALDRVLALVEQLANDGINLHHLDLGGGLGVTYNDEIPPHPSEYAAAIVEKLGERDLTLIFEPGRSIAANAGILVTQVALLKHTKDKNFAVVDAAMNDLLRPALYQAWQAIESVKPRQGDVCSYDVVGPICETGDFLGKDRELCLEPGDLLAVRSSGAYGFSMSSNYNSRNRAAEIMVDGSQVHVVRRRESFADQIALEACLPADLD